MLVDLVIDTNVLMHADNTVEYRRAAARDLVLGLLDSRTRICVDQGFTGDRAENRSLIGGEYWERLQPGSLGASVVAHLAGSGRVKQLSRRPDRRSSMRINRVLRKPRDHTFLGVAGNLEEKVLVSHDYEDFQVDKRTQIRRDLGVSVIEAAECDFGA